MKTALASTRRRKFVSCTRAYHGLTLGAISLCRSERNLEALGSSACETHSIPFGDLEALARDTHKFESRYLDGLVGPYPERRDIYLARSPIHHIERIACPMIIFQGLDDPVVPPNQAQMMYEAVRNRKLPVAYLTFPGEQHGFVKAENLQRSLEAELYFYAQVFKFQLAEAIEPIQIENL